MQIEPPETIHFPIYSLQELQEQRGGLRVSALGSGPRALGLGERVASKTGECAK